MGGVAADMGRERERVCARQRQKLKYPLVTTAANDEAVLGPRQGCSRLAWKPEPMWQVRMMRRCHRRKTSAWLWPVALPCWMFVCKDKLLFFWIRASITSSHLQSQSRTRTDSCSKLLYVRFSRTPLIKHNGDYSYCNQTCIKLYVTNKRQNMSYKWQEKANRWSKIKGKQCDKWKLSGAVDERDSE